MQALSQVWEADGEGLFLCSLSVSFLGVVGGWGGGGGGAGWGGAARATELPSVCARTWAGPFQSGALKHGTANVRADGHLVSFFSCLGL